MWHCHCKVHPAVGANGSMSFILLTHWRGVATPSLRSTRVIGSWLQLSRRSEQPDQLHARAPRQPPSPLARAARLWTPSQPSRSSCLAALSRTCYSTLSRWLITVSHPSGQLALPLVCEVYQLHQSSPLSTTRTQLIRV